MASKTTTFDRYKLDTDFDGDTIFHKSFTSDLQARQRRVTVNTTWKKEKMLGAGAFGVVWRQRQIGVGKLRAVKIIPKQHLVVREVEALIELRDHPDLFVLFLGWFEDPHAFHIAMEYIAHGDLGLYISKYGGSAKAHQEAGEIISQILEGLVVLHSREICHRDLKPQNILIACPSPLWIKITDFGISKRGVGTSFRTSCGTPCYQAPEQIGLLPSKFKTGQSYTKAIDIWALGAVVHTLLTSEIPFLAVYGSMTGLQTDYDPSIDFGAVVDYCRGQPFPIQSLQRSGVSAEGIDFVTSLMAVDPSARMSAVNALKNPWLVRVAYPPIEPAVIGSGTGQLRISEHQLHGFWLSSEVANRMSTAEDDQVQMTDILQSSAVAMTWHLQRPPASPEYVEVVKIQLKVTDDIDLKPQETVSDRDPLAASNDQATVINLLLDHGDDVKTTYTGDTSTSSATTLVPETSCMTAPLAPIPHTIISNVFNAKVVATLTGARRQKFIKDANEVVQKAILSSVPYLGCNRLIVGFCRDEGLVGEVPGYYAKGYSYWCQIGEDTKRPPLERLQAWGNAIEARGSSEHWDKLVIRALVDLLSSFS